MWHSPPLHRIPTLLLRGRIQRLTHTFQASKSTSHSDKFGIPHLVTNMAQKARKDRAKSNAAALNNLHIGTLIVNTLFVLFTVLFKKRSMWLYAVLSVPSFICEYVLESSGRPRYDPNTKALKTAGEDLSAAGLTDYMFDVIWVTWASVFLVILFGNWGWLLWGVVPAYGAFKGFSLFGAARGMAGMQPQQQQENAAPAAGNRRQRRAA